MGVHVVVVVVLFTSFWNAAAIGNVQRANVFRSSKYFMTLFIPPLQRCSASVHSKSNINADTPTRNVIASMHLRIRIHFGRFECRRICALRVLRRVYLSGVVGSAHALVGWFGSVVWQTGGPGSHRSLSLYLSLCRKLVVEHTDFGQLA